MTHSVAIVGRPNVGKSTLFNRLVGRRTALVDSRPGLTRDRHEGRAKLGDLVFQVVDTAGMEEAPSDTLESRMLSQTERALAGADVALFLIDARAGITPTDHHFASWLHEHGTPVILVANKCESEAGLSGILEAYALGFGDPIPVSAEHGEGMGDLYDALAPSFGAHSGAGEDRLEAAGPGISPKPLQLAIVGRPNVGKSTLINRLLGEERMLTGPEPGVTRDAIAAEWRNSGLRIRLIDTAGLRRRPRVTDRLERLSVQDTGRAIQYAEVVVLIVDGLAILEKQDLTIARNVIDEGRALVVAVNKWDLVRGRKEAQRGIIRRLEDSLPQVRGIPWIALSALTGKGIEKLMPAVLKVYEAWNTRIATGALNRWLAEATARHQLPLAAGRRMRIRYATQAKARPPTIVLFANRPEGISESYRRYLANDLRETFGVFGTPLRLVFRKGRNPYSRD
ncbi:MAG: ribosome biogenesis GTPase Der [Rhodospirillales bacterium]|jgi:GTP-binding protein|nr:ribosome biogenesis GTPase Der [Rhodospirillales bacterium]MDP6804928.1 ribosome biogenesis GTPase Der [Rhodospirillales bacterium]